MSQSGCTPQMTNARRFPGGVTRRLARLKSLVAEATAQAWAIGDLVNELKAAGLTVTEQAELIGASRQRLSELRRTAAAFPAEERPTGVDIHFCTVAARSAKRMGLRPGAVLDELVEQGIDSTRAATRYLAKRLRDQEGLKLMATLPWPSSGWDRAVHGDFRESCRGCQPGTVKLVVADPPYGRYAKYRDGKHTTVAAGAQDCDGLDDDSARALTRDLFRLSSKIMQQDGCLIVCRPGGLADPPWLIDSAEDLGLECRHALAWRRGPTKLGDGRSPYTSATERLLVFARPGAVLVNHDGSSTCDILDVPMPRKSYASLDQHLFAKPVELMERLIGKHTHPGETVLEPFGGTGPVSRAAIRLGRRWVYSETNASNFALGSRLIQAELAASEAAAG